MKCPYIDNLHCTRCNGDTEACVSCVALFPDMYGGDSDE